MSNVNTIARMPRELFGLGGIGVGFVGGGLVGHELEQRGVDRSKIAPTLVGGGGFTAAIGTGVVDLLTIQGRTKRVDRFAVDNLERVARSSLELRVGVAGARVVHGLVGAGLGAFCIGASFAGN
jgi:hypothetical protein